MRYCNVPLRSLGVICIWCIWRPAVHMIIMSVERMGRYWQASDSHEEGCPKPADSNTRMTAAKTLCRE